MFLYGMILKSSRMRVKDFLVLLLLPALDVVLDWHVVVFGLDLNPGFNF